MTLMLEQLLQGLTWSLLGFLLGYYLCQFKVIVTEVKSEVDEIREVVVHDMTNGNGNGKTRDDEEEVTPEESGESDNRGRRWLAFMLMFLAVASVIQVWYFSRQDRQISECQARFNEDFALVVEKRAQYVDDDRQAELRMWNAVLSQASETARRQAFVDYLASAQRADELRAEHPLPRLADRNC